MSWEDVDNANSPEAKAKAKKKAADKKQEEADLARAYNRCFKTEDGKRVLADLYNRMVIGNIPEGDEPNINYTAAFKNGEAGCMTYIQFQITRAEVI